MDEPVAVAPSPLPAATKVAPIAPRPIATPAAPAAQPPVKPAKPWRQPRRRSRRRFRRSQRRRSPPRGPSRSRARPPPLRRQDRRQCAGSPMSPPIATRCSPGSRAPCAIRRRARARGASGVAAVNFALDAAGDVTAAQLMRSSGDGELDAEAVAAVRRASPLPAPPADAPRAYVAPIRFDLR